MGDANVASFRTDFDLLEGEELVWVGDEVGGVDVGVLSRAEYGALDVFLSFLAVELFCQVGYERRIVVPAGRFRRGLAAFGGWFGRDVESWGLHGVVMMGNDQPEASD